MRIYRPVLARPYDAFAFYLPFTLIPSLHCLTPVGHGRRPVFSKQPLGKQALYSPVCNRKALGGLQIGSTGLPHGRSTVGWLASNPGSLEWLGRAVQH